MSGLYSSQLHDDRLHFLPQGTSLRHRVARDQRQQKLSLDSGDRVAQVLSGAEGTLPGEVYSAQIDLAASAHDMTRRMVRSHQIEATTAFTGAERHVPSVAYAVRLEPIAMRSFFDVVHRQQSD